MQHPCRLIGLALGAICLTGPAIATAQPSSSCVVFENVRIFDGKSETLFPGHLVVRGERIASVSQEPPSVPPSCFVIEGGGRVLMPGLTDAHWHTTLAAAPLANLDAADPGLLYAKAVAEARRTLLRGFTTVRDMAGATFGLKAAFDQGIVPGPRIYPSGALISQTSGHGDFAPPYEPPKVLRGTRSRVEELGVFTVADGIPEVLGAVRAELKKGSSQIKVAVGGGVISDFDPIDGLQFSPDELRAAVAAARDWGTYVAAHVYTAEGMRRALEAGILSIEHGHLADEAAVRLVAEKGAWLSIQPFEPGDQPSMPHPTAESEAIAGSYVRVLAWAKKHRARVAFGTDLLFSPEMSRRQNLMLTRFAKVYRPIEVMKIATSGNCELFAQSGRRNPYGEAKLGVLEPGAWADMLLVEGDPSRDIRVLGDPERNFIVIVKGGRVYKNRLAR